MVFKVGDKVMYIGNNPNVQDLLKRPIGVITKNGKQYLNCVWTLDNGRSFPYEVNIKNIKSAR